MALASRRLHPAGNATAINYAGDGHSSPGAHFESAMAPPPDVAAIPTSSIPPAFVAEPFPKPTGLHGGSYGMDDVIPTLSASQMSSRPLVTDPVMVDAPNLRSSTPWIPAGQVRPEQPILTGQGSPGGLTPSQMQPQPQLPAIGSAADHLRRTSPQREGSRRSPSQSSPLMVRSTSQPAGREVSPRRPLPRDRAAASPLELLQDAATAIDAILLRFTDDVAERLELTEDPTRNRGVAAQEVGLSSSSSTRSADALDMVAPMLSTQLSVDASTHLTTSNVLPVPQAVLDASQQVVSSVGQAPIIPTEFDAEVGPFNSSIPTRSIWVAPTTRSSSLDPTGLSLASSFGSQTTPGELLVEAMERLLPTLITDDSETALAVRPALRAVEFLRSDGAHAGGIDSRVSLERLHQLTTAIDGLEASRSGDPRVLLELVSLLAALEKVHEKEIHRLDAFSHLQSTLSNTDKALEQIKRGVINHGMIASAAGRDMETLREHHELLKAARNARLAQRATEMKDPSTIHGKIHGNADAIRRTTQGIGAALVELRRLVDERATLQREHAGVVDQLRREDALYHSQLEAFTSSEASTEHVRKVATTSSEFLRHVSSLMDECQKCMRIRAPPGASPAAVAERLAGVKRELEVVRARREAMQRMLNGTNPNAVEMTLAQQLAQENVWHKPQMNIQ